MRVTKKQNAEKTPVAVIGKVKIGEKSERGFPVSLDYFRFASDNPEYNKMAKEELGDKPKTLKIMFLSEGEEACKEYLELRDAQGKVAGISDGVRIWYTKADETTKKVDFIEIPTDEIAKRGGSDAVMAMMETKYSKDKVKATWKHKCKITFVLIGIKGLFGQWTFESGGTKTSVEQIVGAFDNVRALAGRAQGFVFDLSIKKVKSDKSGDNRQYPVVSLTPNMGVQSLQKIQAFLTSGAMNRADLLAIDETKLAKIEAGIAAKQLPAPQETYEEAEVVS